MKCYFIEIVIFLLFISMDIVAQSSNEAVKVKQDVMNDRPYEYIKDGIGENSSSSKSSKVSYYNSQTNKMEKVSIKEMYDKTKQELDKQWNSRNSESRKGDRDNPGSHSQLHYYNDGYVDAQEFDLQTHDFPSNSTRNILMNKKIFRTQNKQLMRDLKGMAFENNNKLKNIDSHFVKEQNEYKLNDVTDVINTNVDTSSNNSYLNDKVDNVIIAINEGDIYFGKTYESLSEKEKKRLMLIERQRFTLTDPVDYNEPTLFESLHQTFIAPIADLKNEIKAYASMGSQGIWEELKATANDEYFEDFYTGMQSQGIEKMKKAPLKKSINYISKRIRSVVSSCGEVGDRLLSAYDSYKRAKDIGDTQKGILVKVFSSLSNPDIDNLPQLSEELTTDVTKSTYMLAHRNIGLPYVSTSKDELQTYTADLFINKIPQEATKKILF